MKKLRLIVYTPEGKKFDQEIDFVQVHTDKSFLGILPGHTSLVSDVIVSELIVRIDGKDSIFAVGEGVLSVENDVVKLIVYSLESLEEIDLDRAISAKERAEKRLAKEYQDEIVDIDRAKAALARALNRINIYNNYNK